MNEIKRCPFRKDENGEFAPCYGAGCMAYYEYDQPTIAVTTGTTYSQQYIRTAGCRRLAVVMPYTGGCAI